MFADACLMPYIHYGDVAQCWLKANHDEDCATANERRFAAMRAAVAQIDDSERKPYGGAV